MKKIYLDNGSTSFPKPEEVVRAVSEYMTGIGANVGRGGYSNAYSAEEMVFETRQLLSDLFAGGDLKNVVFTKNITESLNVVLKGFLKPGDHVLVSAMEHNAMMRPLVQLSKAGVEFDRIPCDAQGNMKIELAESMIKPNTVAIAMLHASNVCGTVMPAKQIGEICRRHSLRFILDAAQSAGVLPVKMDEMNISALCFTGHKSLLGPQGTGGFILREDMISEIEPLISGGTGSISHLEEIPGFMPDRFEPGTMNLPGIMGLRAALLWHKGQNEGAILSHELSLVERFIAGLIPLENEGRVKIIGRKDLQNRVGVVSVQTSTVDCADAAFRLDSEYGIMTRVGLHCAPNAHKTLHTYPTGTIRFSFGYANTQSDVDAALDALDEITK